MNTDDIHSLSGAYAADAVDDVDRARFEAHLARCSQCQEEVASLYAAASALSMESVTPPPAPLRASVLQRVSSERPLAPVMDEPAAPASLEDKRAARAERTERTLRTLPRPSRWLVGVAATVAIITGGVAWQPWSADQRQGSVQLSATQEVLQARDAQRFEQKVGAATATVVRSTSLHQAVIVTTNMPAAPDGSVYELWLQKGPGMVKAGFMPDGPSNTILLDGDAAAAAGVGITVEPTGGSVKPTLPALAVITFA